MTWILIVFGKSLAFFLYRKMETLKLNNHRPPAPNSPTAPAAVTNRFLGALARNKNRATLFVDLSDPLTLTELHFFPALWKILHSEHMFEIQFRSSAVIL